MTKENTWLKLYESFLVSGMARKVFCEQQQINMYTFKYWQRKFELKPTSNFISIKKPKTTLQPTVNAGFEIELRNGVKIRTVLDFDIIRQLNQLT